MYNHNLVKELSSYPELVECFTNVTPDQIGWGIFAHAYGKDYLGDIYSTLSRVRVRNAWVSNESAVETIAGIKNNYTILTAPYCICDSDVGFELYNKLYGIDAKGDEYLDYRKQFKDVVGSYSVGSSMRREHDELVRPFSNQWCLLPEYENLAGISTTCNNLILPKGI